MSFFRFMVRQICDKIGRKVKFYDVKNKTFINFTFVKGRTLVISNITILHP